MEIAVAELAEPVDDIGVADYSVSTSSDHNLDLVVAFVDIMMVVEVVLKVAMVAEADCGMLGDSAAVRDTDSEMAAMADFDWGTADIQHSVFHWAAVTFGWCTSMNVAVQAFSVGQ